MTTTSQPIAMDDGFTLTINDPNNILGSNQAALIKDINFVIDELNAYITFVKPLDLEIDFKPASANPNPTADGLMPASPQWVFQNNQWILVSQVKGQTGVDLNGAGPDSAVTIYAAKDGTLKNYGAPLWFDPTPQIGVAPAIPSGDTDFTGVVTHELFHTLGFAATSSATSRWNDHTYELNGVYYFTSPTIQRVLGGDLPLAPNETVGYPADHIGNTSIAYQPVTSDLMFEWGNYAANRLDIGQLDLLILQDLGWSIKNYQSLPLVDPIDSADVTGTPGNDVLYAPKVSAIVSGGAGDDEIVLPSGLGNGNYLLDGGTGNNSVVVSQPFSDFALVKYGADYLLQNKAGADGVSLLRSIQTVAFSDATVQIDQADANRTITAVAPGGGTMVYAGSLSQYVLSSASSGVLVHDTSGGGTDTLIGMDAIQFADSTEIVAKTPGTGTVTTGNMAELYGAVFGREPDVTGLTFYNAYLATNTTTPMTQFAQWFLDSPEYTGSAAHDYAISAAGDAKFITDSYENLLHRAPAGGDIAFYQSVISSFTDGLAPGTAAYAAGQAAGHALVLAYFSGSPEFLSDVQITAQHPADAQHWLILI